MNASKTIAILLITTAVTVPAFAKKDKSKTEPTPAAPAATATAGDATPAATVGGTVITMQALDAAAANQLAKFRQQEYDIRAEVLTGMIQEQLIVNEAAAQGHDERPRPDRDHREGGEADTG